ncbi:hypothetical protein ACHMW7_09145 [Aminobacter sp. UC22_36]|uniref:hypothetical protein n=1 Tax=Aminobacter sp. UC22_36 TaxID=3374549 RepID=UPI003757C3CB
MAFIFDASRQTPAELARKRAAAEALAGPTPMPRNVGEGLTALGEAIGYRMTLGDIARGEAAENAAPPVGAAQSPFGAGPAGPTGSRGGMNGPAAATPAVQRVAQALGAYRGTAADSGMPFQASATPPAGPTVPATAVRPTQAQSTHPLPTPHQAMSPDIDARAGPPGEAQHSTSADPLSILGRELDRYEKLVRGTGIEAMPGQDKDNLNAVRQGIMLRMKPLFDPDGPDLSRIEPMIYDPVVAPFRDGGLAKLPDQLWTGAWGEAGARAQNSAAELRRMLANTRDVNAINEKYGLER